MARRLLMIGLDSFELTIAEKLMAEGRLPTLKRIAAEGAMVRLDHKAKRTGLAWEQIATGRPPEATQRWSVVELDSELYSVMQRGARIAPFPAALTAKTVVFDIPYFLLSEAPKAQGLVAWGAHDASVPPTAQPPELAAEVASRFGAYPSTRWIYGASWDSAERTRAMAKALVDGIEARAKVAEWLFAERLPDWELGMLSIGEYHSAIEAWWHGIDPAHPLYGVASAAAARDGLVAVYEAADRMIGRLATRFPDARLMLFAMHGMGPNDADNACMLLLPELLHRRSFGKPRMRTRAWPETADGLPLLREGEVWEAEMRKLVAGGWSVPASVSHRLKRLRDMVLRTPPTGDLPLAWMPATLYARFWPKMRAFALPAFLDGRVRINLKGRERHGMVEDLKAECAAVETLLGACRDALTGEPAVRAIDCPGIGNCEAGPFAADMIVSWNGAPLGLVHPELGTIGPVPFRRTGGHTGKDGVAWFAGAGFEPGEHPRGDAVDLVPTVVELLGEQVPDWMFGKSIAGEIGAKVAEAAK